MVDLVGGVFPELIATENESYLEELHERINRRNGCSQMDKECRGIDHAR